MTAVPSWLEEVARAPDDEYTRLVAADVVSRADPVRAGFIRAQVVTERALAAATTEVAVQQIVAGELALDPVWAAELAPSGWLVHQRGFARGFIEHVQVAAADFLARGAELFERAPIRFVTLAELGALAPALAACPRLARIRALRLPRYAPHAVALVDGRAPGGVEDEINAIDDAAVAALCGSPHIGELELLDLTGHAAISIETWARLAAAAPRLRWVIGAPLRGELETLDAGYELSRWFQPNPVAAQIEALHGRRVPWLPTRGRLTWWQRVRAICAHAPLVDDA